jgi:LysR family transcriptional regulator, nitrogen assimilation regulatory protein
VAVEPVMDLRQLRYFVGIVQAGSLSRAADHLRVAQSAISLQLASLETELGRQLVTRGPKGIALTEAGSALYRHAEAILRHVEHAKHDTVSAPNSPSGRVAIGLPVAWSGILGYELFARLQRSYPQIVLCVADGNSALLRERLDNGRLDLAVLFVDQHERGLAVEPLFTEELFYASCDPDPSPISLAQAAQRPLLMPGGSTGGIQRATQRVFDEHGLTVTPICEIDSMSMLRRAVAEGMGSSIMSWAALYDRDDQLKLYWRRFADAKFIRPVALCFSELGQRTPAIEAVADTLKSLIREQVESGLWEGVSLIEPAADELSISPAPP